MFEQCWYKVDGEWISGRCRALFEAGALVTPEVDGSLIHVGLENLWLHANPPTHSQFGEPEKHVGEEEKHTSKSRRRVH